MPLVIGEDRLIPGFEANLVGLKPGESTEFDITFPDDYPEETLAGQEAHFAVDLKELREKVLPDADDAFAQNMGDYADLAALKADIETRLKRNALDRARHEFADKIIEYAVANSTIELPDILVDQEVEVMHDEFRSTLARQGIAEAAYIKATGQTEQDLHAEFRPRAEHRTKVLLTLTEIANREGIDVPESEVEEQVALAAARYQDQKTVRYFESERGRNFIRSTLRRTRLVETLVDRWLAAHPEHPPLPHLEDDAPSALDSPQAEANAALDATDPGAIPGHEHTETTEDEAEPAEPATASPSGGKRRS
jgi:trigger factor